MAWYRPDAEEKIVKAQQDYVQKIGEECAKYDILFLFELLVYPLKKDEHQTQEYIEMKNKKTEHVLKSVEEFANEKYRVDLFKLESPVNVKQLNDNDLSLFKEMGTLARKPWVMLSAGAGKKEFKKVLKLAFKAGSSGFLAGRAIWLDAFHHYPDWGKVKHQLENSSRSYLSEIGLIAEKQALPWINHNYYSIEGSKFPYQNSEFRNLYKESIL